MKTPALALSLLTLVGCATGPDLRGQWQSACAPMSATQAFTLDFDVADETWGLDYVVYGDAACGAKFLTVRIDGPYEIHGASDAVAGAHEARFGFTSKTVTPHSAAAAGYLSSEAGCNLPGFAEGVAKDIGQSGCANLGQRPIAACSADYDLVWVDGDALTFGARPADNDMCTDAKRPTALSTLASKRR